MKMPSKEFFGQMLLSMFGGGIFGPIGLGYLMNYGGNNGCFAWADALYGVPGYESCMQLGLHSGVLIGSLIGFLVWQYISVIQRKILAMKWVYLGIVYILGWCLFLGVLFVTQILFFGMPFIDSELSTGILMMTIAFVFASVLSIIPFLVYKGIQHLAAKK